MGWLVQPVAKATLDIADIREDIEDRGQEHGHQLVVRHQMLSSCAISGAMQTNADQKLLYLRALHLADDAPYTSKQSLGRPRRHASNI
jgi:GntR family histidine utilization transcriptional repressor